MIPVSTLFRDPRLAAIFRRGEEGDSLTVLAPVPPTPPVAPKAAEVVA